MFDSGFLVLNIFAAIRFFCDILVTTLCMKYREVER